VRDGGRDDPPPGTPRHGEDPSPETLVPAVDQDLIESLDDPPAPANARVEVSVARTTLVPETR